MTKADHIRALLETGLSQAQIVEITGYKKGTVAEVIWRHRYPDADTRRKALWLSLGLQPHVKERKRRYSRAYCCAIRTGCSREEAAAAGRAAVQEFLSQ